MLARGEFSDFYQYEEIPERLENQLVYILGDIFRGRESLAWNILKRLVRELGFSASTIGVDFSYNRFNSFILYQNILFDFVFSHNDIEVSLSVFELSLLYADQELVDEFNKRCLENGFGYQFESGQIVRIDSQYIHQQAVIPALSILSGKAYSGPQEEFLSAHEHFRNGRHQEALVDALKSFESTMKVICDKRGWEYCKNDTAKKLIAICFENGLIPGFWQSYMNGLRSTLEGGVPTVRNKMGGHGQGAELVDVPDHIAAYALHLTASTIVFLVKSEQNL